MQGSKKNRNQRIAHEFLELWTIAAQLIYIKKQVSLALIHPKFQLQLDVLKYQQIQKGKKHSMQKNFQLGRYIKLFQKS
ncbi:unnamed protein product [Paramecium octaurelia]|uniref:Uncharacterized protein n=1 Tax=Paramecium octaurelia TaxID=43137 RepID=A0A8S1WP10_PAROT|nr:unnamed protein product [Paramecium octaurelia]